MVSKCASIDNMPWKHPYLTTKNINRFREYSEAVWQFALDFQKKHAEPLKYAFVVNMAQNMYKWGCLAKKDGADATLFLNPLDNTAISSPEWEEFEAEYSDIFDREGFLSNNPGIKLQIPCHRLQMEGSELYQAYSDFNEDDRKPLLRLLAKNPGIRHEVFFKYEGFYPYYRWAKELAGYEVIYAASTPFAAYASGRPYCVFSVGGDLQIDCGRLDDLGKAMSLSFNAARFLMISNPHTLGHSRRLGFINGVYLPYPMDDTKYCPGIGSSRKEWEAKYGKGVYVLTTSRIDKNIKGYDEDLFKMLKDTAIENSELRFIFLEWGANAEEFKTKIGSFGLQKQFIILPPVGKIKLIDYYRSCDIVMDHFVYGYYGTTALEAASIGKPVIMKLHTEQYSSLYKGDVMPALSASESQEIKDALLSLIQNKDFRLQKENEMRQWLVRNHGEKKNVPLMLALLRLAADGVQLPEEIKRMNPLNNELSEEEITYHKSCEVG